MKKVLCGMICVAAGASFASITNTVATVDVIAVNSSLSNTVVAVCGLDLAGGNLAISNLVKTTNLTPGDRMLAFSNGKYDCWTLSDDMVWVKPDATFRLDALGDQLSDSTPDASLVTKTVGSGIWISRQNASTPIYIYAQHTNTLSTTVAAKSTALLGNPSQTDKEPAINGCADKDQIIVPTSGLNKTYTYASANSTWYSYSGLTRTPGLPTITAGTGFWYVSKGNDSVTVSW